VDINIARIAHAVAHAVPHAVADAVVADAVVADAGGYQHLHVATKNLEKPANPYPSCLRPHTLVA
jgi:hypothetical protein